jgi:hypothetical protein
MSIKWNVFDPNNLPEERKPYLTTDGRSFDISWFPTKSWGLADQYGSQIGLVTHYVKIELPTKQ